MEHVVIDPDQHDCPFNNGADGAPCGCDWHCDGGMRGYKLWAPLRKHGAIEQTNVVVVPFDAAHELCEVAERLRAGAEADLANGWQLRVRRVAHEPRIELVGPDFAAMRELEADGVFAEVHAFRTRFFVPTGERAVGVLRAVTEHRPVVEMRDRKVSVSLRRAA